MNTKLLTLFFVLCTYFQITAALPYYQLSAENFEDDFNAITEDHLEAFIHANNGIGLDSVRSYLRNLLGAGSFDDYLQAPTMCIAEEFRNSLSIEVNGDFDTYYFSYFKAQDGAHQSILRNSNNFEVSLEHGWQLNLLAIYGSSKDNRSNLYIIIIDKDLFLCDTNCDSRPSVLTPRSDLNYPEKPVEKAISRAFSSSPNPTFNQTILTFQLDQAQKISLEIVSPSTGKTIARKLENQYLLKGTYQYDFDLQSLPVGMYLFVLKTAYDMQSIPIVKIE